MHSNEWFDYISLVLNKAKIVSEIKLTNKLMSLRKVSIDIVYKMLFFLHHHLPATSITAIWMIGMRHTS